MYCPNCGKRIQKKKLSYCPHCGESLNIRNSKYSDVEHLEVLIRRNKNDDLRNTGNILIFIGVVFFLLIFGIYLIVAGIIMKKEAKANSRSKHEILYFDKENQKYIFYSYNDIEYIVDKKDIIKIYNATLNDEITVKIIYKNKTRTINLGFAFKEDVIKVNKELNN